MLALWDYLLAQGVTLDCYFDANTVYVLREFAGEQSALFTKITEDGPWSDDFHVVPSGTQADEWILRHAKAEGSEVVSNDHFKDRARKNPWIWKRRHEFSVTNDCLALPSLNIAIAVSPDPAAYLQRHC